RAVGYHGVPEEGRTYTEPLVSLYFSTRYCVGCGTCDLVCPMGLAPRAVCTYIKKMFSGREGPRREGRGPSPARSGRRMPTARVLRKSGLESFQKLPTPLVEVDKEAVGKVRLLLRQGIGGPAVPLVRPGQKVGRGEMVAGPPKEGLGVALHASIDGKVAAVTEREIVIENRGGAS
ncbi:MAG: hypothetical protein K6U03_01295, partial [Firmicutes bacterium]|nr:hypothetical protein [Bacillota bacterium]